MAYVVLVDKHDKVIGKQEKLAAHKMGSLHRAFSVILFRKKNNEIETLLQKRNVNKYHSGGLWTNTCCSHPLIGESIVSAGKRRLQEELGLTVNLVEIGNFIYRSEYENGLIEHELDHVLCGYYNGYINKSYLNFSEVQDVAWREIFTIKKDLIENPSKYTSWFDKVLSLAIKNFNLETL